MTEDFPYMLLAIIHECKIALTIFFLGKLNLQPRSDMFYTSER